MQIDFIYIYHNYLFWFIEKKLSHFGDASFVINLITQHIVKALYIITLV